MSFLEEVAAILLKPEQLSLQETCVVFPNKRARLFLSRNLGVLAEKPTWAPAYLTMNELMEKLSGYIYADRLTLLFELFEAYKSQAEGEKTDFSLFFRTSDTLLSDFDEMDKYLVNAEDLFRNLSGLRAMDEPLTYLSENQIAAIRRFWASFNPEKVSVHQKSFIALWELLPKVYAAFRNRLREKGLAYEGMAYRHVAESLTSEKVRALLPFTRYVVAGFNALNPSEQKLLAILKNMNLAEFLWDYDLFYLNDPVHEAGRFMRSNLGKFPQQIEISNDNISSTEKEILIVPVSSASGQASLLPSILSRLGVNDPMKAERTAIVFADEGLLIPVLYSLPESLGEINVSIGYPVTGSIVSGLVESLYEMFRRVGDFGDGKSLQVENLLSLFSNPLMRMAYPEAMEAMRNYARTSKRNVVRQSDMLNFLNPEIVLLIWQSNRCTGLVALIEELIRLTAGTKQGEEPAGRFVPELLFELYSFLIRLRDAMEQYGLMLEGDMMYSLIRKMLRTLHIPLSGEPLAGIQVLGMLETRTLDFDQVIILSANEDVLPPGTATGSFIPPGLRKGFGMPMQEHSDAVYAYHFWHLLHRTKKAAIVYNQASSGLSTGEPSRFIRQLQFDFPLATVEWTPVFPLARRAVKPIVIKKNNEMLASLAGTYADESGVFTPSAFNAFLTCPLRFYFKYVAKLKPVDPVSESADARILGNLFHQAIRIIYEGFGGRIADGNGFQELLDKGTEIAEAVNTAFRSEFGESELPDDHTGTGGYRLVMYRVILSYIRQIIITDQVMAPLRFTGLECRHSVLFPCVVNGIPKQIRLGGIIDRVDEAGGKTRIVDYKTGTPRLSFPSIGSLFDGSRKDRNEAALQVLLYSMVWQDLHPDASVAPALYYVRAIHRDGFSGELKMGKHPLQSYNLVANEFRDLITMHLNRLFSENEPFYQTTIRENCLHCGYADICMRH